MTTRSDVAALYVATFDRSPDAPGLDYWTSQIDDRGWTIEMVAQSFFDQDETQRKYPDSMPNGEFIIKVYNNVLDRNPDKEGFDYWLDQLDSGAIARNDYIVAVVNSVLDPAGNVDDFHLLNNKMIVGVFFADCGLDEAGHAATSLVGVTGDYATVETAKANIAQMPDADFNTRTAITALYIATFDRSPDSAGLDYWTAKIEVEGWTIEMVAQSFFQQDETKDKYPDALSNEDLVNEVYNNVLGRAPDQAGFDYWVEQLDSGAVARYDFIIATVNAVLQPGGNQDDLAYLSNKMEVGEFFADSGREDVDDAASSLIGVGGHYSTVIAAKNSVLGMPGGETTLDAMLTTGVDNLIGVFGNDLVTGVVDDVLDDTLTDGDTFDGGRGTDTLQINSGTRNLYLGNTISVTDVEKLRIVNSLDNYQDFYISGLADLDFEEIAVDAGGKVASVRLTDPKASTIVAITNNTSGGYIHFKQDDISTVGKTTVSLNNTNLDLTIGNYFMTSSAMFSAAETVYTTVNLLDLDGSIYLSGYSHTLNTGAMANVAVNTVINVENIKMGSAPFHLNLSVNQAGGSVNNIIVNLTNTNYFKVRMDLDSADNGTSAEDVVTLNLNGATGGISLFEMTDAETFNVNVLGDSEFWKVTNMYNQDGSNMGNVVVNVNADADLTLQFWGMSNTLGDNTTFNMTGAGNVTINDFGDDDGGNVTVAAATATGNISLDGLANTVLSVTTGSGDDSITVGSNGVLIQTNAGADNLTLDIGDDTVRYVSAIDSQLTLSNVEMSGFDVISNFSNGSTDIVELASSLDLASGDARADMLQKGSIGGNTPADMQNFIDNNAIDFFADATVDRATAFADDGTNGYLYIDANNDGDFTEADDMVIQLAGVTTLAISDIQFG